MRWTRGLMVLSVVFGAGLAAAAEAPVGTWKTIDEKTGKVVSEVQLSEQGGKLKVRGYLGVFYKTQTWVKGS